jgi:hypothetical protein
MLHIFPSSHLAQLPPQSVSVSSPFFVLSLHIGLMVHFSLMHCCQSAHWLSKKHTEGSHPDGQSPPQSTPSSIPFLKPSEQLGALHTCPMSGTTTQNRLRLQSSSAVHFLSESHGWQLPPQSTSLSSLFCTLS